MRARQLIPASLVFLTLAFVFSPLAPASGQAPGGVPVQVTNTAQQPVPVTVQGSLVGTVNALQSGAWNVGITGTPTVRGNVGAWPAIPANEFHRTAQHTSAGSVVPIHPWPVTGLLPTSTKLAITSVAVTSRSGATDSRVEILAVRFAGTSCFGTPTGVNLVVAVSAKLGETAQVTFPQPLIVEAPTFGSGDWCLQSKDNSGTDTFVTVVGYRI